MTIEYIFKYLFEMVSLLVLGIFTTTGSPPMYDVPEMAITGTTSAVVVNVIDGDTIDVRLPDESKLRRIRYIGIDTPEPYANKTPDCGSKEATNRNQELVEGKTVTLVPGIDQYDNYGRLLAYVYAENTFLNELLIAEGFARVMMIEPNTGYKEDFINFFNLALKENRGIWANCKN